MSKITNAAEANRFLRELTPAIGKDEAVVYEVVKLLKEGKSKRSIWNGPVLASQHTVDKIAENLDAGKLEPVMEYWKPESDNAIQDNHKIVDQHINGQRTDLGSLLTRLYREVEAASPLVAFDKQLERKEQELDQSELKSFENHSYEECDSRETLCDLLSKLVPAQNDLFSPVLLECLDDLEILGMYHEWGEGELSFSNAWSGKWYSGVKAVASLWTSQASLGSGDELSAWKALTTLIACDRSLEQIEADPRYPKEAGLVRRVEDLRYDRAQTMKSYEYGSRIDYVPEALSPAQIGEKGLFHYFTMPCGRPKQFYYICPFPTSLMKICGNLTIDLLAKLATQTRVLKQSSFEDNIPNASYERRRGIK